MREFKYDVIKLIEAVRDRPCLWNRNLEIYKDRVERRTAWEEIYSLLDERYHAMSSEEKRNMEEYVMAKWTNTRDSFIRSLKIRKNGRPKRKYIHYDYLKFLTTVRQERSDSDFNSEDYCFTITQESEIDMKRENQRNEEHELPQDEPSNTSFSNENYITNKSDYYAVNSSDDEEYVPVKKPKKEQRSRKTKVYNESVNENINFVEVDETINPRLMNEDEAFFASLLPTVVRYNEDDRLQFRIEVLNVMNRIREKQRSGELSMNNMLGNDQEV